MKKFTYEIWNKSSKINGIDAQYYLKKHYEFTLDDVILFKNSQGIVERIESVLTLKNNYNIDSSLTSNEVAKEYLKIKRGEEENRKSYTDKISILSEQNAKLLLDSAIKTNEINALNKNAANLTLEIAKMKGGM
ncbi:hypothetical protein [Clostridium sp. CCUG 7971]|uniref:hypothetical protein n=1 Tax=Clostridium sp. CCUG 7971 TaxID=2811414 RepID=UPI001ABB3C86|nr:hypothetical protein [Clostridium sp. CCUG 7971]MBO3444004.1 hypothetical protein [Clostridium sp. CCUG 7971]